MRGADVQPHRDVRADTWCPVAAWTARVQNAVPATSPRGCAARPSGGEFIAAHCLQTRSARHLSSLRCARCLYGVSGVVGRRQVLGCCRPDGVARHLRRRRDVDGIQPRPCPSDIRAWRCARDVDWAASREHPFSAMPNHQNRPYCLSTGRQRRCAQRPSVSSVPNGCGYAQRPISRQPARRVRTEKGTHCSAASARTKASSTNQLRTGAVA